MLGSADYGFSLAFICNYPQGANRLSEKITSSLEEKVKEKLVLVQQKYDIREAE